MFYSNYLVIHEFYGYTCGIVTPVYMCVLGVKLQVISQFTKEMFTVVSRATVQTNSVPVCICHVIWGQFYFTGTGSIIFDNYKEI